MKKIKDICTNRRFQIIFGAVVAALLIIFIIIFSLPANRAKRSFLKANELFNEGEFEQASQYYSKAVTLKNDFFLARRGLILADSAYDTDKAQTDLINSDTEMAEITSAINEETLPVVVEIYLLAPELFGSDKAEMLVSILESGCTYTDNAADLQPALSDAYALMAQTLVEDDVYRAVEFDQKAKAIIQRETGNEGSISKKLTSEINKYIDSDDYDNAYNTISKYESIYAIDSKALTEAANAAKDLYDTKVSLLGNVYSVMEAYYSTVSGPVDENFFATGETVINGMTQYDFSALFEYDGSDEAEKLATSFTRDAYIYAPEFTGDYSGLVCGLYTYGEPYTDSEGVTRTNYYFYFGEYKNGARNGYGISFSEASASAYKGYEGEWKDDAPNGFGSACKVTGISEDGSREYTRVSYGSFNDGIETGIMNVLVSLGNQSDMIFAGTYNVENGIGTEISDKTDDYEILDEIPEEQSLIAVLPSSSEGYNIYVKILQKKTETLSAIGF